MNSLVVGLFLLLAAGKLLTRKKYMLAPVLLTFGILFDEYYRVFNSPVLNALVTGFEFLGGASYGLFFALPMLLIGSWIAENKPDVSRFKCIVVFLITYALGFLEATMLKNLLSTEMTLDISIFGWVPAVPLLLVALNTTSILNYQRSRMLRKSADIVYIIHLAVFILLSRSFRLEYLASFAATVIVSFSFCLGFEYVFNKLKEFKTQQN